MVDVGGALTQLAAAAGAPPDAANGSGAAGGAAGADAAAGGASSSANVEQAILRAREKLTALRLALVSRALQRATDGKQGEGVWLPPELRAHPDQYPPRPDPPKPQWEMQLLRILITLLLDRSTTLPVDVDALHRRVRAAVAPRNQFSLPPQHFCRSPGGRQPRRGMHASSAGLSTATPLPVPHTRPSPHTTCCDARSSPRDPWRRTTSAAWRRSTCRTGRTPCWRSCRQSKCSRRYSCTWGPAPAGGPRACGSPRSTATASPRESSARNMAPPITAFALAAFCTRIVKSR